MKFFNTQINPNEITLLHLQKNLVTCDLLGKDRNSFIEKYNREEDALTRFEEIVAEIEDLGLVKINFGYYTIAKNISTMNFANKKLSITFKDEAQIQVESEQSYVDNIVATQLQAGGGSGGVTNYEKLTNLPSVNGVTLKGDKNSSSLGLQDKLTSEQLNAIDQVKDKQDKLTAGKGIEISADGVITATGDISNLQHSELLGRDVANQHPISAIEGLQDALGSKQNSLTEKQLEDINKIDEKQDSLTATQLKAVNSGITSEKVSEYDSYATTKQDALSQEQLESVNSTITKSKVDSFEALKTSKQDSLTDDQLSAVNSGITATKLTKIDDAISKIPENITTQGNEFNNANQLVKLDENSKLPAVDGSLLTNLPTSSYGIKGDYFSKYGITKCQNGLIKTTLDSKEVVVLAGIECFMPGATTKITIASNITYEVKATTKTTLFLAGAEIIEAEDVFYQETEPEDGSSTYVAWYNPKTNEWKFKSNDTGNVFRTVRATPIADVYVDGSNITRIDYIGYRVFNDTIYATKDDLDTVSNSLSTKQDALTTEQLNAVNSGITETNFNELNIEVETIKNDQETLGNDLGTLSNTVGLKDDLPDISKSITQNISSISTKVSGLIKDDESSATTTYSSSKILGLIGDIHTFDVLVVDALPDVGVEKTIYFVPAATTKDKNIYDEYLYINNAWELIGSTQVDLSNYLKIDGSNGTETGINALLNLISAGEDDILDTSNILFENTAFKKKTALSFVNYLKGKIIDDTNASTSTVYSSSKIEEINTQVWSGTTSEFEALDKTTLKDGQVVNITDDYDEPNTKDVYSLSEVKTNKVWVDGKPIYRTVAHTTIPNEFNKYVIQEFDGTNIDRLITLHGGVKQLEGSNQTTISFYRDTTDGLFLYFDNAIKRLCAKSNIIGGGDAYIVIEYTKTTD